MKYGSPIKVEEIKAQGDDWEVAGYLSTYNNIDLGFDVVMPGAFDRWLEGGKKTRFLYSHRPDQVLGSFTELRSDKVGLFGRARISKTTLGSDIHTLLQDGAVDSFSIGYETLDADHDGGVRYLKQLNLPESSLVSMPMNPQAVVTAVKDWLVSLGMDDSPTLAEKAHALSEGLAKLLSDTTAVLSSADRPLTNTKRQELTELLETFSGLDAVRSDLQSALTAAPIVGAKRALYELRERRSRLSRVLME